MMFIQVETTFLFNEVKLTIYKKQKNKNLKIKNLNEKYSYTYALSLKKNKKIKKKPQSEYKQMSKKLFPPHKKPFPKSFCVVI